LAGIAGIFLAKAPIKLIVVAGGGETVALSSKDKARIERLHAAIVSAISAR
jgi:hypothetical protein